MKTYTNKQSNRWTNIRICQIQTISNVYSKKTFETITTFYNDPGEVKFKINIHPKMFEMITNKKKYRLKQAIQII